MLCFRTQKFAKIGYVFFFDMELISVEVNKGIVKKSNKDIKKKLKEEKVPLLQRAAQKETAWEDYGESLIAEGLESILAQNKDALVIKYSDILKFKLTPYRRNVRTGTDLDTKDYLGEISVKSADKKLWYNHRYQKEDEKFIKAQNIKDNLNL